MVARMRLIGEVNVYCLSRSNEVANSFFQTPPIVNMMFVGPCIIVITEEYRTN